MNTFTRSISQLFRGALKAFQTFPASIGCALAFAVVTMIRIQLDWPQQEPYNFLFNCLHWAFALGAIFSLAAITAAQSRLNRPKAFLAANLLGVLVVVIAFLALYLYGGKGIDGSRYAVVSALAAARVCSAMLVSLIAFVILAGYPKDQSNFAASFFMTHKAFFIALIYGIVIMAGTSGVARAVQFLLYRGMSSKVYLYLGTLAGFLTFTMFIGYFPDFRRGAVDEHRQVAQKQPRFIEILFTYILVPIVLALTLVLLIWAGKTVLSGIQVNFVRLSAIAASYTLGGLWLHVMVAGNESWLAKWYRRIYPIASIVILVFEAWAVGNQLRSSGLKLTEYFFILIWIVAAAGAVLLLIQKFRAYQIIAVLICTLAVVSVLPTVGYQALPVTAQVRRLETLLVGQGMLKDEKLIPASAKPAQDVREAITDAVGYLAGAEDAKLPAWFDKDLNQSNVFQTKLGFEQAWPQTDPGNGETPAGYLGTYLYLPSEALDISGYRWSVNPQAQFTKETGEVSVKGDKGTYAIDWTTDSDTGIPTLRISLGDRVILEQDLHDYIDSIAAKYPPMQGRNDTPTLNDMTLRLQSPELEILLVFSSVEISVDTTNDTIHYGLYLDHLYLKENT